MRKDWKDLAPDERRTILNRRDQRERSRVINRLDSVSVERLRTLASDLVSTGSHAAGK